MSAPSSTLTPPVPHLILYSRSYCHLCEDMLNAFQRHFGHLRYELEVKDLDACPEALVFYDELVPVLLVRHADGTETELCHYFLDVPRVTEFFEHI
ncbi:MAG: glutaredoxin family protein [Burkholderiales bacterium]|nr:glutaredoxin family protein [Burkholderiales bacterium]